MGHLRRCLSIAAAGRGGFDSVVVKARGGGPAHPPWGGEAGGAAGVRFAGSLDEVRVADLVVSDVRETSRREMSRLWGIAPVLSIDDLGAGSRSAHVSIRTPSCGVGGGGANFEGYPYVVLGEDAGGTKRPAPGRREGVLISFGGSDPGNLSALVASLLLSGGVEPKVVRGPFFDHDLGGLRCEVVDAPQGLPRLIRRAEALITSYGIAMFEAFALGTPVILVNQSGYHSALARGLPLFDLGAADRGGLRRAVRRSAGTGAPGAFPRVSKRLARLEKSLLERLSDRKGLSCNARAAAALVDGKGAERVARVVQGALGGGRRDCLLGHADATALIRSPERTVFRCRRCGDLFMFETRNREAPYDSEEYFTSEYRKRYGRTYLEDRDNIARLGEARIRRIERILGRRGELLDVGCAMGFFLDAARKRGWSARGVEVSRFAAEWGRRNLSLDIRTGSFEDFEVPPGSLDVVTFFYVAEHFSRIETVVSKAARALRSGGMLVLALPNRSGAGFRLDRGGYLARRPVDHFFDTCPKNLSRFLRKFDIIKKCVVVTGIHPERVFPRIGEFGFLGRLGGGVYARAAEILRLGDTFELYGVKK
jgi:SAM-dependent methyltransferase